MNRKKLGGLSALVLAVASLLPSRAEAGPINRGVTDFQTSGPLGLPDSSTAELWLFGDYKILTSNVPHLANHSSRTEIEFYLSGADIESLAFEMQAGGVWGYNVGSEKDYVEQGVGVLNHSTGEYDLLGTEKVYLQTPPIGQGEWGFPLNHLEIDSALFSDSVYRSPSGEINFQWIGSMFDSTDNYKSPGAYLQYNQTEITEGGNIPEPSSLFLLGAGAIGLMGRNTLRNRRKRKRKRAA